MDKLTLLKSHIDQYTRKDGTVVQAHDDKRQAAQPAAVATPPINTHAKALRASSKPGDLDHEDNQIAAGYMKEGDHKALAGHLKNLDTAARDHILDHVHPDHREGLGFQQLNMDRSKKQYAEKFGPKDKKAPASEGHSLPAGHVKHADSDAADKWHQDTTAKLKDSGYNWKGYTEHGATWSHPRRGDLHIAHGISNPADKSDKAVYSSVKHSKPESGSTAPKTAQPESHHSPEHHVAVKKGFDGDKDVSVTPSKSTLGDSDVDIKQGENFVSHSISPRTKSDGSKHFAVNGHAKVGDQYGPVTSAKSFSTVADAVDHIKGVHAKWREYVK